MTPVVASGTSTRSIKVPSQPTRLISEVPVPTLFHEKWWLEITGGVDLRESVVTEGNQIVGRLPYVLLRKKIWWTSIQLPPMTHALGPALAPEVAGASLTRSNRRFGVTLDLIAQLPPASHVRFKLHRGVTDTLAFDAAGFSTSVEFTVEIAPDSPETLWRQMRDKVRNVVRRAEECLTVIDDTNAEGFLNFYGRNIRERQLRNHYDRLVASRIITECLRRGSGRVLTAVDAAGRLQAAIFTVWDSHTEYYLMSTRALGSINGAISLLIWTALQHAAAGGRIFDMDGVNSRRNLLLVTGFGGSLQPQYVVHRTSLTRKAIHQFARILTPGLQTWSEEQGRERLRWRRGGGSIR